MKAIPFPQANKVLKAPPSPRDVIQALIDKLSAEGADMSEAQAKLDAAMPPEREVYDLPVWGGKVEDAERCISCWEPSPEERARIAAGDPVWLWVMGTTHPPLVLDAANPFEPPSPADACPTAAESFRELTARLTLTPEEEKVVRVARIAASPDDLLLLAIIDRLTGRETPAHEPEPEPEWVDTTTAEEEAERLRKLWPLPCRPGGTEEPEIGSSIWWEVWDAIGGGLHVVKLESLTGFRPSLRRRYGSRQEADAALLSYQQTGAPLPSLALPRPYRPSGEVEP